MRGLLTKSEEEQEDSRLGGACEGMWLHQDAPGGAAISCFFLCIRPEESVHLAQNQGRFFFAPPPKRKNMKQKRFPPGWDEKRVREVLAHYEAQSEAEAVAEDEAAFEDPSQTLMKVPNRLVPKVRELIAAQRR